MYEDLTDEDILSTVREMRKLTVRQDYHRHRAKIILDVLLNRSKERNSIDQCFEWSTRLVKIENIKFSKILLLYWFTRIIFGEWLYRFKIWKWFMANPSRRKLYKTEMKKCVVSS